MVISDASNSNDGFGDLVTGSDKSRSPEYMSWNYGESGSTHHTLLKKISSFHVLIFGSQVV
jgi:hypothetical protein